MREKGFRLRLVERHQSARRKPSGRSPMDRSTEIELLEELAGLRGSRSFHLDDAIATSPVARYTCPERFSRERQMLFRASSTATTRGAYTPPSAISAPTTSRRNSPASRSNRPPETVRPQGPHSTEQAIHAFPVSEHRRTPPPHEQYAVAAFWFCMIVRALRGDLFIFPVRLATLACNLPRLSLGPAVTSRSRGPGSCPGAAVAPSRCAPPGCVPTPRFRRRATGRASRTRSSVSP